MTKNDGGPAFPQAPAMIDRHMGGQMYEPMEAAGGMTLRDWFAGQALESCYDAAPSGPFAWIARLWHGPDLSSEDIAQACYEQADAMLKERDR